VPRSMAMSADMKPSSRENIQITFVMSAAGGRKAVGLAPAWRVHKSRITIV
jgi:hypothetical protein